jgi:hypothetical protein
MQVCILLLLILSFSEQSSLRFLLIYLNTLKPQNMRKNVVLGLLFIAVIICFLSCSKDISIYEAANGKARCGKYIR